MKDQYFLIPLHLGIAKNFFRITFYYEKYSQKMRGLIKREVLIKVDLQTPISLNCNLLTSNISIGENNF